VVILSDRTLTLSEAKGGRGRESKDLRLLFTGVSTAAIARKIILVIVIRCH
jgi:hypothetical protein